MMDEGDPMHSFSPDARLYLAPAWFTDSPIGRDGMVARLGSGLIWFQGFEVRTPGQPRVTVPVSQWDDFLTRLSDQQRVRLTTQAANLSSVRQPLALGPRTLRFDTPQIMGILNITPDSFSDGGRHFGDAQAAADAGFAMHAAGAAIVDVGGESTRPKAEKLWEGDEIERVIPVIERLAAAGVPVSVDTRKAGVMRAALAAGAVMVNDISALQHDPQSLDVVAASGAAVVLMHSPSSGDDPHANPRGYGDVAADVFDHLERRIALCRDAGIDRHRIFVDPGLGFGKTLADNLALTNALAGFQALGQPLLFAASRKRMIGALSNEAPASARLGGSVALAYQAAAAGAQMLRVHDVPETLQAVHVWRGLRDRALTAP